MPRRPAKRRIVEPTRPFLLSRSRAAAAIVEPCLRGRDRGAWRYAALERREVTVRASASFTVEGGERVDFDQTSGGTAQPPRNARPALNVTRPGSRLLDRERCSPSNSPGIHPAQPRSSRPGSATSTVGRIVVAATVQREPHREAVPTWPRVPRSPCPEPLAVGAESLSRPRPRRLWPRPWPRCGRVPNAIAVLLSRTRLDPGGLTCSPHSRRTA